MLLSYRDVKKKGKWTCHAQLERVIHDEIHFPLSYCIVMLLRDRERI